MTGVDHEDGPGHVVASRSRDDPWLHRIDGDPSRPVAVVHHLEPSGGLPGNRESHVPDDRLPGLAWSRLK
jgi:hypothetical protein